MYQPGRVRSSVRIGETVDSGKSIFAVDDAQKRTALPQGRFEVLELVRSAPSRPFFCGRSESLMTIRALIRKCSGATRQQVPSLDHALVAHRAELIVLQPEQIAKNLVVLGADGFAQPVDFAGCSG